MLNHISVLPDQWPLVAVRDKAPYMAGWQRTPLSKFEVLKQAKNGAANGAGILLGGDWLAVDIDGTSAALMAEALSGLPIGEALPTTVQFTSGKPGRCQLLYRVPTEYQNRITGRAFLTGATDASGKPEQLDFRYTGKQSVLVGAHPETGSYRWLHSPDTTPVADCPEWILDLLSKPHAIANSGNSASDQSVSLEVLSEALDAIDPDCDYNTWLGIGMSLYALPDEAGFDMWDQWSSRGSKYRPGETVVKWDSFAGKDSRPEAVIAIAKDRYGWALPKPTPVVKTDDDDQSFEVLDHGYEYHGDLLCDELRAPIERIAAGFNQPPVIATAALLTVAASCLKVGTMLDIGGSTNWKVPPILWTCVVGESGSTKSPYLEKLVSPLYQLQTSDDAVYEAAKKQYKADLKAYEAAKTRSGSTDDLPDEPTKPTATERYVSDYTLEALSRIVAEQPENGLLVWNDELKLFFASMDAYKKQGGGDRAQWLGLRNGSGLKRNRKGDDRVSVARTAVSVLGGIQPEVLAKLINGDRDGADGLYPRFLWLRMDESRRMPPLNGTRWDATERFRSVYERLSRLEPREYRLSPQAFRTFNEWHMECESGRIEASNGLIKATISKYKGMAASVALILHCLNSVASGESVSGTIPESTMIRAIDFTRWAVNQAKSLFAVNAITTDKETASIHRLVKEFSGKGWIKSRTIRDFRTEKGNKKMSAQETRDFMHSLVTSGVAIDNDKSPNDPKYEIQILSKTQSIQSINPEPQSQQAVEDGLNLSPSSVHTQSISAEDRPLEEKWTEHGLSMDLNSVHSETQSQQAVEEKWTEWTENPEESDRSTPVNEPQPDNSDCHPSVVATEVMLDKDAAELAAMAMFLGDLADEFN